MGLIAIFSLLLSIKHSCINFMPRERPNISCLIRIELLLETDLEAGFQQVSLHLRGCLEGVFIDASGLNLKRLHVFLRRYRLIVQR